MTQMFSLSLCLFMTLQNSAYGANLLFMHSYASYSHRVSLMPLANALLSKGHNVTYIAPMSAEHPNPQMLDIIPKTFATFVLDNLNSQFDVNLRVTKQTPNLFSIFDTVTAMSCEVLLNSDEFISWMKTSPHIDLVVGDLVPDCAIGIAYKLNAKFILYNTVPFYGKMVELFKLPDESLATYCDFPYKPTMSFLEKVKNTLLPLAWAYYEYKNVPYLESVLKQGLNITNLPSIYDLYQNVSLVFVTGNYVTEQPLSLPPMFVSVPGLHLQENHKDLPKPLEQFINSKDTNEDESEGFVYISLGTVVIAPNLPLRILSVFMNAIRAFPKIKFLWRWGGEFPKDTPKNLYMAKWFPQQDVLSHSKIRAFITQGGRPSLQEAISNGVPMITFPILGGKWTLTLISTYFLIYQDFNAMRLEEIGAAISLEIGEVTDDQLQGALSRVLHDNGFKNSVQKKSTVFKDLPMRPIDTAIWWTEYVLRHDDMSYLKPLARHQTWYERRKLDVWCFIFICVVMAMLCFIALLISISKWFQLFTVEQKLKIL